MDERDLVPWQAGDAGDAFERACFLMVPSAPLTVSRPIVDTANNTYLTGSGKFVKVPIDN